MPETDRKIAEHYTHGDLRRVVFAGLEALSATSRAAPIDQLARVDEFHIGGRVATRLVAERLGARATDKVLDIGCGLGGAARFLATTFGCHVSGIDLTEEYIRVGSDLNTRLGLGAQVCLTAGSALDMPYGAAEFDRAVMLHVGMNIADKAALFAAIARVLKPGADLVIYDVMRQSDAALVYPVAWSSVAETSFLATPAQYSAALEGAGFEVQGTWDQRDLALGFFAKLKAATAAGAPPPLGLHIVMGQDAPIKIANMYKNIDNGIISPVIMSARRC